MADDPSTNKRQMDFSIEGQPPSKQSCESTSLSSTPNEQNSPEIDHGSGSEDCGHDEKFQHENEGSEKNQGVNKIQQIQTEEKCSNVEQIHSPGPIQFTSVQPDSISLVWGPPEIWNGQSFKVTWESGEHRGSQDFPSLKACICNLLPGEKYEFKVVTLGEDNQQSEYVSATTFTEIPAPDEVMVNNNESPVMVTWKKPEGLDQVEYVMSLWKEEKEGEECLHSMTLASEKYPLPELKLNIIYTIRVSIVLKNGYMGKATTHRFCRVPAPEKLRMISKTSSSVHLIWDPPLGMEETPYSYQISYHTGGPESEPIPADSCSVVIKNLKPCTDYLVNVRTKLKNGEMSEPFGMGVFTAVPVPEQLIVVSETARSVHLRWNPPHGIETPLSYQISYRSGGPESNPISADSCSAVITGLQPDTKYDISVCTKVTNGEMSAPVKQQVHTAVLLPPSKLTVVSVTPESIHITWSQPNGMDRTPHSFQISYHSGGTESEPISADSCSADITGLQPDTKYDVSVCTKLNIGEISAPVKQEVRTKVPTKKFYTIVIGNTQNHHNALKRMLMKKGLAEVESVDDCDVILAFCVIVSRVGTDMVAALKEIPDSKPAILVVMHHTFDTNHVTPNTSRFVRGQKMTVIDILFHEDQGILKCEKNSDAQRQLLIEFEVSPESDTKVLASSGWRNKGIILLKSIGHSSSLNDDRPPPTEQQQQKQNNNKIPPPDDSSSTAADGFQIVSKPCLTEKTTMCSKTATSRSSKNIKYFTILSGNTLKSHAEVQKRLTDKGVLQAEVFSVKQCDVLLVFCPVVSSFGSDIEKAFRSIPDGKPAVVVVMHHTFDTDFLPPCNNAPNKRKDILVVHCLFFEDIGLLKSSKNDDSISRVTKWLCERFPQMAAQNEQNYSMPGASIRNVMSYFRK
ncbi:fibronectin-like isoform X2 [Alosa sapidissima]|uniref:fibronectin-like isoform X2 n=1 Tax=Alosa sapidissima TaxID=34773 RepID=UPI001C089873|nr:fibronectin-like isoform X2 [Alosa sapidissima]